jgi:translocation and assembly module TamB
MTRARRIALEILAAAAVLALACLIAGVLIVRSGWFQEKVRERIVAEVEKGSGGKAEIGTFNFDWRTLTATVAPFILHGTEAQQDGPLVRIERVTVGLRILSMLERKVDLASLTLDKPRVRILIYPDGSNNLPVPEGAKIDDTWAKQVVDLAVRRYSATEGVVEVGLRKFPVDLKGEDLHVRMDRDLRTQRYPGTLGSRRVHVASGDTPPVELDLSGDFTLDRTRLEFSRLIVGYGGSTAELKGSLTNLQRPRGTFQAKAEVQAADAVAVFSLPIASTGKANFEGRFDLSFEKDFDFTLDGHVRGEGLGYSRDRIYIHDATATADLVWTNDLVKLDQLALDALGVKLRGDAVLKGPRDFSFDGGFESLSVAQAVGLFTDRPVSWTGTLSGDLNLTSVLGEAATVLHANAVVAPGTGGTGVPLDGLIALDYDQKNGTLRFGDSRLATPSTTLDAEGTLGEVLNIRLRSSNLDDLLPALALLSKDAPAQLPLKLRPQGQATANGAVRGALDSATLDGVVAITAAEVEGHSFDRFTADVEASAMRVNLKKLTLQRGQTQISGDLKVDAQGSGFGHGALDGRLNFSNASLSELAKEFAGDASVDIAGAKLEGLASGTLRLTGPVDGPREEITATVQQFKAYGEQFDRIRASIDNDPLRIRVREGMAELGAARLQFEGGFTHDAAWKNGDVELDVTAQALPLNRLALFGKYAPQLAANLDARVDGGPELKGRLQNGTFVLGSLNGRFVARNITYQKDPLGSLTVTAETKGRDLLLTTSAQVQDSQLDGQGTWRLDGDFPGTAALKFTRMNLTTLYDLVMLTTPAGQRGAAPPFEGSLEGAIALNIALKKPEAGKAQISLDRVQFNAKPNQVLRLDVQPQDVMLRNTEPIVLDVTANDARIRTARFTGRDTNLEATGMVPLGNGSAADVNIRGTVNLTILQLLNPDMLARGTAQVAVGLHGSLQNPQITGRMELNNASLYANDAIAGLDSANGVVLFDRNRATIDRMTAQSGGGTVSLTGFMEFGSPLVYRLQADAHNVRLRSSADLSVTGDAKVNLNGTSEASTLSGTITLNRAALNPSADFGRLLTNGTGPTPSASPTDYLRGMRFDIRVENSPTFELETSLTRNVQASVDLRLRGSPVRPLILGTISVSSGEMTILGNRYTVNRGDIRFLNPVSLEPTLDVNLETRARGITVNVSVSGSPQKLNVNYSSDPPLQTREIIALLAVGRDPTGSSRFADTGTGTGSSAFASAGGLIGQAVSDQLSNRLQRFFGASRVKIDPTLSFADNLPAARLTLEQQVSRDITLTYVTNLNRTQEQIVRLQWDLNAQWSAVAVRNTNGLFGIDFQYRKRFK